MMLIWLICGSHSRSGWNGCSLNTLNTVIYLDYQSWCPCLRIPEEIRKKDATQATTQGVWGPPDAEFNWCEEEPNVVYDSGKSRFDLHCMHTYLSGHSQDSVQSAWVRAHVLAYTRYTATQSCQRASSPAVTKEYDLRMSIRTYISYYDYILYSTYVVCIMSVVVWMSCILWTLLFIVTVEKRTTRSFFLSDWRGSLRLLPTHFAGHARTISCPSGLRNPWILPHASSWFCSPSCSWQRMRLANMKYKYQFTVRYFCHVANTNLSHIVIAEFTRSSKGTNLFWKYEVLCWSQMILIVYNWWTSPEWLKYLQQSRQYSQLPWGNAGCSHYCLDGSGNCNWQHAFSCNFALSDAVGRWTSYDLAPGLIKKTWSCSGMTWHAYHTSWA